MKHIIRNLKIEIERWQYRRKQRKAHKLDADSKAKAIIKANLMTEKTNKRFWVIRHGDSNYGIYSKCEVKGILRSLHLSQLINMYQVNQHIIHITRRAE